MNENAVPLVSTVPVVGIVHPVVGGFGDGGGTRATPVYGAGRVKVGIAAPSAATVKATLATRQLAVHPLVGHPKYNAPLDPGATPGGDDHKVVQLAVRTCTLAGMP
jgi:hypothetical protein